MMTKFANNYETLEEIEAVLDRDCEGWRDRWDDDILSAAVEECVIEPEDKEYFTTYRPLTVRDDRGNFEGATQSMAEILEEWESLGDCEEEFGEDDLPAGYQEVDYDTETGDDLWEDDTKEQLK